MSKKEQKVSTEELKPKQVYIEKGDDVEISMDAELFSNLFSLVSCFIESEVQVRIEDDGLYVRQMDEAHVGLVDAFIPKPYFKVLKKGQQISELRLPVNNLKVILSRLNTDDVVKFTVTDDGKLSIEIVGKRLRSFNIPLLKEEELDKRRPIPMLNNKVKTSLEGIKLAIEDADKLISRAKKGDYSTSIITLKTIPMGLEILASTDDGLYSTKSMLTSGWDIIKSDVKMKERVMVSILYLVKITTVISKVTNIVQIEFSTDFPLHIIPELPWRGVDISYWIAPRINPEEMAD